MAKATKILPTGPSIKLELTEDEAVALLVLTGRAVAGTGPIGRASEGVYGELEELLELDISAIDGYLDGHVRFLA